MLRRMWQPVLLVCASQLLQCASLPKLVQPQPPFIVETVSATCQTRLSEPSIEVQGNTLIVTESLQTPNPCYGMQGAAELRDHELRIDFYPEDRGDACIDCLGDIVGRVTVTDLPPGDYTLSIHTRQRESRVTVTIP